MSRLNNLVEKVRENLRDYAWLLFRVFVSAMFITHGSAKLLGENPQPFTGGGMTTVNIGELISIPMPFDINALFLAGSIELVGGALILIGLWTQLAALIAALDMVMAYLIAHLAWFPTINNGELAAMYFFSFLIIFCIGPGEISLDAWLEARKSTDGEEESAGGEEESTDGGEESAEGGEESAGGGEEPAGREEESTGGEEEKGNTP